MGILTRGESTLLLEEGSAGTWEYFDSHRAEILGLISPAEFIMKYPSAAQVFTAEQTNAKLNAEKVNAEKACPFLVEEAEVGHGALGCGPALGYEGQEVTNFLRCDWTLSAHAPSRLVLHVLRPVRVIGFLNGSVMYCHTAEFLVDGAPVGQVNAAYDTTRQVTLAPGTHVLEVRPKRGSNYCHTVCGFDCDARLLETPKHYVAVGAICKDENDYLVEWVQHHRSIGVSHFYLLDNSSAKPLAVTVAEAGLEEWVTVEDFPTQGGETQRKAYLYLAEKYAAECFWMAFIDIDEFFVPNLAPSLPKLMLAFEEFGGLQVRWVMFGADGHEQKPVRQLGSYQTSYVDPHCKVIVQPRFLTDMPHPHTAPLFPNRRLVGEHFDDKAATLHLQLNHYWTRSRSEWANKIARGALGPGYERSWADFERHQELCIYRDTALERFWANARRPLLTDEATPVVGFIHLAAVNHWRALLESQLKKCKQSGLWERTRKIYLGIVGAEEEFLQQLGPLPDKVSVLFCEPDRGGSCVSGYWRRLVTPRHRPPWPPLPPLRRRPLWVYSHRPKCQNGWRSGIYDGLHFR